MQTAAERTDAEWIEALRSRGPARDEAQRDLRALLVRALHRALSARTGAAAIVEDCAQEALLRVEAELAGFRGESRFTTWAITIAVRLAFRELRRLRWKDTSLDALVGDAGEAPVVLVDRAPTPEREAARRRALDALSHALEHDLTLRQRELLLAELRGMPQEEIARQMNTNLNALYKLGHDARKRLKLALEHAGLSAEQVLFAFEL